MLCAPDHFRGEGNIVYVLWQGSAHLQYHTVYLNIPVPLTFKTSLYTVVCTGAEGSSSLYALEPKGHHHRKIMPNGRAAEVRELMADVDKSALVLEAAPGTKTGYVQVKRVKNSYQAHLCAAGKRMSLPGAFGTAKEAAEWRAYIKQQLQLGVLLESITGPLPAKPRLGKGV